MRPGRKTNKYKKIRRLLDANSIDDKLVGIQLLLSSAETMHPDEWHSLNWTHRYSVQYHISPDELQEYLYDKRQEEIRANKGRNTKKADAI